MNWEKFWSVIVFGFTAIFTLYFVVFVFGLFMAVINPWTTWGVAISFIIALFGLATAVGRGWYVIDK